jgi:hypothetical protein
LLPYGEAYEVRVVRGQQVVYSYGNRRPRCQRCKKDIDVALLPEAVVHGHLVCACGDLIAVREADGLARHAVPGARWLVHEVPGAPVKSGAPVLFSCLSCAGALSVDGSERLVQCRYCDATSYLPDDLWLTLHPAVTSEEFFVVAALSDADLATMASADGSVAQDLAGRTRDAAALSLLARHSWDDVRKAVVRNEAAPVPLVVELSYDPDWDVRRETARSATLPASELRRLASDRDSDVREAVFGNPRIPESALVDAARSRDWSTRHRVSKLRRLPLEGLLLLAHDGDSDVQNTMLRRRLPAQVIAKMASHPESRVRQRIAKRQDLDDASVLALGRDAYDAVKAVARRNPRWREARAANPRWWERILYGALAGLMARFEWLGLSVR